MKNLPTLNVSDEIYDRVIASYGSEEAYTKWLYSAVAGWVSSYEIEPVFAQAYEAQSTNNASLMEALTPDPEA